LGNTLEQSLEHAYERVSMIDFEGRQYRKDIGESSIGFCIHTQYRKNSIDKEFNK